MWIMFDPKPALVKYQGQRPGSVDLRTERQTGGLLPTPFDVQKLGKSGLEISEMLPQLGSVIDELCVIRSMYTFNPTHTPGLSLYHTGTILLNRPSMGAWVSYGLGTENENLPAFVALTPAPAAEAGRLRDAFRFPAGRASGHLLQRCGSRAGEDDPESAEQVAGCQRRSAGNWTRCRR